MSAAPHSFGPIRLPADVSRINVLAYFYGAFFSISLLTVLNFLQAYIITEHLGISTELQGGLTGNLGFLNELIALVLVVPFGVWSDRLGRRLFIVSGLLILGASYVALPLIGDVAGLYAFRVVHSVGAAGVAGMLGIIVADYAREESRGKLVAFSSMLIGLGVVVVVRLVGQLPAQLAERGFTPIESGSGASWCVACLCFVSAGVLQTWLKSGTPADVGESLSASQLLRRGLGAARDLRIAFAYAIAFVSRSDQAVSGLFISLWALQTGIAQGMESQTALANATTPFIVAAIAGLCIAPLVGFALDRIGRMPGMAMVLVLGCVGYTAVGFISDPLSREALPLFALLGIGQTSTLIGGQSLIAKIAPVDIRGSVIGVFGFFGAIGMMLTSLAGGRMFDSIGPWAPFIAVGILQGLLFVVALLLRGQDKTPVAPVASE